MGILFLLPLGVSDEFWAGNFGVINLLCSGTAQQPGIIFLAMQELFERISERSADKETEVTLSYLEIYNETIRDLLVPGGSKSGLSLREDANQSVSVAGLSSHKPQNVSSFPPPQLPCLLPCMTFVLPFYTRSRCTKSWT
jgi:hypothetical protein